MCSSSDLAIGQRLETMPKNSPSLESMVTDPVRPGTASLARVLIAPDKFRPSASAAQLRRVLANVVGEAGLVSVPIAISDGGEGLLESLGGEPQFTTVTGPLGQPVLAEWRRRSDQAGTITAIIEMARASGLALVGGGGTNDPLRADTRGTGELIRAAIDAKASTIIVGCGGSASTDGGAGALAALGDLLPRADVVLKVACDVTTTFLDAPAVFGPQKGASPDQVRALRSRLEVLSKNYRSRYGVELDDVARTGAAGGLAGGLFAIGGVLVSGIDLVAEEVMLDDLIASSDLVITGEGKFDETSLEGKAVGALLERTRDRSRLLIIVGEATIGIDPERNPHATLVDLVARFGVERSFHETLDCVEIVAREALESL